MNDGDNQPGPSMEGVSKEPAVVLVATEGEWAGRSLESVLVATGYAVLQAGDGSDAIALARRYQPDAVILDEYLPGIGGIEVCRKLHDDPTFDASTPIVITAPSPASRTTRSAAHEAGAWEFCTHPVDADTLLAKLRTFLRAKHALAEARGRSLIDPQTGVLTALGMEQWAEKLAARAIRNREALACVVLMPGGSKAPEVGPGVDGVTGAVSSFLALSRDAFRRSDVVGRMGDGRLALLAPDTDADGVHGLLARLRSAVAAAAKANQSSAGATEFKAGYWAVQDFSSAQVEPAELLRRAARALDHISNPSPRDDTAFGFDQIPVS
jgi:PleD family two-component response regulator